MGDIAVALAAEHEAPACMALLPEVRSLPAEFLIARRGGAFAGAAAIVWRSWSKPGGFPIWVQVLPEHRRAGVGRSLLAAAAELTSGEAAGLWSLTATPEDGIAAEFMRACGFALQKRERHFIAEIAAGRDHVLPQLERLRARGRMPADARIVPLAEAPLDAVSWLVSAEFGSGPVTMLHRLQPRAAASSRRERSLVAMQGGEVTGALICRSKDGVGVIDGWVAAPGWRNGWTNLALFEAVMTRALHDGFEEFRFHCDETVKHTLSMAEKISATEVARLGLYYAAAA
jgi:GNAT superfamily N-acetyltransferase